MSSRAKSLAETWCPPEERAPIGARHTSNGCGAGNVSAKVARRVPAVFHEAANRAPVCEILRLALTADEYKRHQARIGQRVNPSVSGSILNDAIALTKMDRFSVVEFQNHFAPDDNAVIKGVRAMHSWRAMVEVLSHPRNLLRQFVQELSKSAWRAR